MCDRGSTQSGCDNEAGDAERDLKRFAAQREKCQREGERCLQSLQDDSFKTALHEGRVEFFR